MPNLLITTYCNRSCPYCFAQDTMSEGDRAQISFDELVEIADQIVASGRLTTGVLGGEPTLHAQFYEIVNYLLERRIQVTVFTNGLTRRELIDDLQSIRNRSRLKFVVNVNFPETEPPELRKRQEYFLTSFADICDISLNFYRKDLDPTFLAELAERVGIRNRRIRVGIAQPIVGASNEFLVLEDYKAISEQLCRLAESVLELGLVVSLDCGFALCAFSDEQLGRLRRCRADTKFVCQTATDLAPGREAWSCFPLTEQTRVARQPYGSLPELVEEFKRENRRLRGTVSGGLFDTCAECVYRKQQICDGGCLAHAMQRKNGHAIVP